MSDIKIARLVCTKLTGEVYTVCNRWQPGSTICTYHSHARCRQHEGTTNIVDTNTYKRPTLNIAITPNFFSICMFSLQIVGRGSRSTARSAKMVMKTFAHPCPAQFAHFPLCSPSQKVQERLIGEHCNRHAQKKEKPAREQKTRPILTRIRNV